jgi:hypothetical protein
MIELLHLLEEKIDLEIERSQVYDVLLFLVVGV